MGRVPLPGPEAMTAEQRAVHDEVVGGKRGVMIGPLRAAIHSPELARRWSALGEILRFDTTLPKRVTEVAILVTGRRWTSQVEFLIHGRAAAAAGVSAAAIEAMRVGEAPVLAEDEAEAYAFARELQQTGRVGEAVYAAVRTRWGDRGVVELTAVIGYYTMVSMTLNAHEIPVPAGELVPFAEVSGLVDLPEVVA